MSYGRVFELLACRAGRRKATAKWLALLTAVVATWTIYPVAGCAATPSPAPSFDPSTARPMDTLPPGLTPIHSPSTAPTHTLPPGYTIDTPSPGSRPYIPTRIDWLTTTLQASLRDDELDTNGFILQITSPDPSTILIFVRYTASANRQIMDMAISTARKVVNITARSYGWDKWLKIREDVGPG
jgi:hypothetical protein